MLRKKLTATAAALQEWMQVLKHSSHNYISFHHCKSTFELYFFTLHSKSKILNFYITNISHCTLIFNKHPEELFKLEYAHCGIILVEVLSDGTVVIATSSEHPYIFCHANTVTTKFCILSVNDKLVNSLFAICSTLGLSY